MADVPVNRVCRGFANFILIFRIVLDVLIVRGGVIDYPTLTLLLVGMRITIHLEVLIHEVVSCATCCSDCYTTGPRHPSLKDIVVALVTKVLVHILLTSYAIILKVLFRTKGRRAI